MPPFVVTAEEEQMEVDQAERVQEESLGDENDEEEDDQDEQPEVEDTLSDSDSDRLSQYRIEPIALNPSKRTNNNNNNNNNNVAADQQQQVQNEEKGDEEAEETPKKNKFERVGSEEEVEKYEDGEEVEAAEDATNSQKKKKKFERVWSEEDEISFLQGIMDFTNNGQGDPSVEIGKFLNFIKKYLHFIPTEHQLKDKMKRLKTKYENKAKKFGDEDPVLHRPHEHKSYLLSKQIWGSNIVKDYRTRVSNTNTNANTNKKKPNFGLEQMLREFKQDSKFPILANVGVEKIVELLGTSRANELDQQWRNLFDSEIKVCLDKLDLIREQAKLISNARKRKSSSS